MTVKIRKLRFETGKLPGRVHLVLADAETRKSSQVWISARFQLDMPSSDRLPLLALEAVDRLQKLIDEGREAALAPPDSNS